MVENETLKKEMNELTRALGNAYGEGTHMLKCLGSQSFSLNKERYTHMKGQAAFVTPKASFVKGNGQFVIDASKLGI
jgi:heterodisulfide reductase subunit B